MSAAAAVLRRLLLALTVLCAAGLASLVAQSDDTITVVTYNIRYANPNDGADVWENRREAMVAYLRATGADLIGLQEVEPQQRSYLAGHLTDYAWYGVGRNAEHDQGEGTPIFYRRDRFDAIDRGTFWLSTTPEVPSSVGWDAALPRVVSWMKLRDRRSGRELVAVNTHFDHRGAEAGVQSAQLLTRTVDKLRRSNGTVLPAVITGDFNVRADSETYRALTAPEDAALAFVDAQHVSRTPHAGGDSTSNGFKAINPGAKIDYVFVRDLIVERHVIEDPRVDGRFVSDHLPVVVQVRFAAAL
jgi:endonuclease/exonuclease/phosphatase family metal-dependent hydrolase